MVEPHQVEPTLSDVIRLLGEGELVVFGSATLALLALRSAGLRVRAPLAGPDPSDS